MQPHNQFGFSDFNQNQIPNTVGQMAMPLVAAGMPGMQYTMTGMIPGAPIAVATPDGTQLAPNHGMAGFGGTQHFTGQPIIVGGAFQQNPYMQPQV